MRKYLSEALTVALMAVILTSGILTSTIANAKTTESSAPKLAQRRISIISCPVGEPNPITSYKTLKEASKVTGFPFYIPKMKNYKRTDIQLIDKEIYEIIYTNKKNNELTFRKAKGKSDISGDYREYTKIKKQKVKGKKVKFLMKNKKVFSVTWYYKGYSYAIYSSNPIAKKAVISLIKKVN